MSNLNERIEKLEKELAQLKAEANKPNNEWPMDDDIYWVVGADGDVCDCIWANDSSDLQCKSIGNIYRTEEEAKHRFEQLKLIQELKEFGGDEGLYHLWFYCGKWDCGDGYSGLVQFPSKAKAAEAIEHFGDRLNILITKK